jgi:transcriptional regulator of acetoin/glycerol metabolism
MRSATAKHSEQVLHAVHSGAAAHSAVAASWCRSALRHGLDPAEARRRERLGAGEMAQLRQRNGDLLAVATPVLDTLYGSVGRTGCGVVLSDRNGLVLETRVGLGDAALFSAIGLDAGVEWSEAAEGTNGIGTCLAEGRAVNILRHEHFASRNVGVSCMDAPIFDPMGQLVAALDVSSCRMDHGEAMAVMIAALVQDAARQIERDFFMAHFGHARVFCAPEAGAGLLAVDQDDLVIGATRAARRRYGLSDKAFADPRPLDDVLGGMADAGFAQGERTVLRQALARSGGNVAAAARSLGIGRATFYRRMERAGLSSDK